MTGLLVGTFVVGGVHTLLWLPRAMQMRRELREAEAAEERELQEQQAQQDRAAAPPDGSPGDGGDGAREPEEGR
jgi:hypothetical protein